MTSDEAWEHGICKADLAWTCKSFAQLLKDSNGACTFNIGCRPTWMVDTVWDGLAAPSSVKAGWAQILKSPFMAPEGQPLPQWWLPPQCWHWQVQIQSVMCLVTRMGFSHAPWHSTGPLKQQTHPAQCTSKVKRSPSNT